MKLSLRKMFSWAKSNCLLLFKPRKFWGNIYAAYLTLIFVDEYDVFPAIQFADKIIKITFNKAKNSRLIIRKPLIIQPWLANHQTTFTLGESSTCLIKGEFILGDDVHIRVAKQGKLIIEGRDNESGSGITARCVILVNDFVSIGADTIIAWDTFITDSDWHLIDDKLHCSPTIIGNHVWIAQGVSILRGAEIGENSIVGSRAVVLEGNYPSFSLIAGVPAQVIKTGIYLWKR